jgi:hypothetical protein
VTILFAAAHPERTRGLVLVATYSRMTACSDYPIGMPTEQLYESIAVMAVIVIRSESGGRSAPARLGLALVIVHWRSVDLPRPAPRFDNPKVERANLRIGLVVGAAQRFRTLSFLRQTSPVRIPLVAFGAVHLVSPPEKISRKNRNTFNTSRKIDAAKRGAELTSVECRSRWKSNMVKPAKITKPSTE